MKHILIWAFLSFITQNIIAQETELLSGKNSAYYQKKAKEFKDIGNLSMALEACKLSISVNPSAVWSYDLRADIYMKLEKYDSAILDYSNILNRFPENNDILNKRGNAYVGIGSYDAALRDYETAASIDSSYTNTFFNIANVQFLKNNFENAQNQYNFILNRDPNNEAYNINAGWLSYKIGAYDFAANSFYNAKTYAKIPNAKVYYFLILAHIANRNYNDAYSVYLEMIQKNLILANGDLSWNFITEFVDAIVNNLRVGKNEDALVILKKARNNYLALKKNSSFKIASFQAVYANLLITTGIVFEKLDSLTLALDYYNKSQLINPYNKDAFIKTELAQLQNKIEIAKNRDILPPEIILKTPQIGRGQGIFADADTAGYVLVSGTAKDPSGINWVKVNGVLVDNLQSDGSFSAKVKIANTITIQAADRNGNTELGKSFLVTKVNYKKADGDIPPIPTDAAPSFHALLIAESEYDGKSWNKLPSTTSELSELASVLINKYHFESTNIDTIFNKDKTEILQKLNSKIESLNENDNLIICFSGHGTFEKKGSELIGYWVPINTTEPANKQLQYISNFDIQQIIAGCRANHILMLSDACYSGAFRGDNNLQSKEDIITVPYQYEFSMKSRNIITSGGLEKVPGESQFMHLVIKSLNENPQKYLSMYDLFAAIAPGVKQSTNNQPVIYPFGKDGNEGGQFFFIKNSK